MKEQNFKNHGQLLPSFHVITFLGMLAILIGSIISLAYANEQTFSISWVLLFTSLTVISIGFHARLFALKAQDRAIRAEENLRYFILTGKRMDLRITLKQIIALRFASDDEFVELTKKAVDENLSQKEIKKLIKNWRADHYRV